LPARTASLEEAVRDSDIIVTATPARQPVLDSGWIRAGTHVSAMGADAPGKQELPVALLERAQLFCDVRAQSVEIGEFQTGVREQRVSAERITPVGEVIAGMAPGRADDDAITIFDSSGMALQDLALADMALRLAQDAGEATLLPD
jgi:ornithine cyclodeaminase